MKDKHWIILGIVYMIGISYITLSNLYYLDFSLISSGYQKSLNDSFFGTIYLLINLIGGYGIFFRGRRWQGE